MEEQRQKITEEKQIKKNKLKEKIRNEINNSLDSNFILVNTIERNSIDFLIYNNYMPKNKTEFCNELIKSFENIKGLLKKYNFIDYTLHFYFTEKNPFANETSEHYKEGGYIKDCGSIYLIYLNPTPIEIKK